MAGVLRLRALAPVVATAAAVVALATVPAGGAAATPEHWVAAWSAAINGSATGGPANASVRNIVRVTLGGTKVRIRLSNALSTDTPLVVGSAYVAIQKGNTATPEIVPGTSHQVTFGGQPGITIPPKTDYVYSDPVDLPVEEQQNLAVTLFLPAATEPGASAATWNSSFKTADGAGDLTTEESGSSFTAPNPSQVAGQQEPDSCSGCTTYALTAVDVFTDQADGAIVGLGSSTFHGYNSDQNKWNTVLNDLSVRVDKQVPAGQRKSIVNAGVGGDTLHEGLNRIDRDVYSQTDVKGVIVYDVNDLSSRTAAEVEDDYRILIEQAHARGIKVLCPTWPPAAQSLAGSPPGSNQRHKLNAWILNSGECDDIVDWDAVLRGEALQDEYDPAYLTDGIHPNAAGHKAMADAVPLRWVTVPLPGSGTTTPPCADRRKFTFRIHQPHGGRVTDVKAYVNGRLLKHVTGRRITKIVLRRLPKGRFTIEIIATTTKHTRTISARRYRGCLKGRPHTHVQRP